MPPQQPQNPQDPNQPQPLQPQPVVSQAPSFQQTIPPNNPSAAPSNWNTLFILALVFDVILPIVGLILGEVLYRKAKAAGDDAWRKKARGAIAFGCLVMIVVFVVYFLTAFNKAKNDTSSSSDNAYTSQSTSKGGLPTKDQATLYVATIDSAIGNYYSKENSANQPGYKLSFPTLAQLNDPSWRTTNGVDLSQGDIPSGDLSSIMFISGTPTKANEYGYTPSPAGCQNTQASPCTDYILTADSTSGLYTDNTANDNIH